MKMEENKGMTLIEGMKRLHLLEKKIDSNKKLISEYSSLLSNEKPKFATESEQREKIRSLVQSNIDLSQEYYQIHARVNVTNILTKVNFMGRVWTVHEMILYRRKLAQMIITTYNSLNESDARNKQRLYANNSDITVIPLYDESFKQDNTAKWTDILENIDGRLETVNATTQLMSLDDFMKVLDGISSK